MTAFTRLAALAGCLALAATTLGAASSAQAATISRAPDGALLVTAAPGEQNRVVLGAATDDTPGEIAF